MQKKGPYIWVAVLLLFFAGCATTDDPTRGGAVSAWKSLLDGGYEKRVQVRLSALDRMKQSNRQLEIRRVELNRELTGLKHIEQKERAELNALRNELNAMEKKLKSIEVGAKKKVVVKNRLKVRLFLLKNKLRAQLKEADDTKVQMELKKIQAEKKRLLEEINKLGSL